MTMEHSKIRQLFSLRYDGQLEGSAARSLDEALESDPSLAEEYESFAEVIDLVRGLPRPEPDPDFVSKVSRRIKRRQRGRRRARREHASVPMLGTLTTVFALVLVAGLGFITHNLGTEVSALEPLLPAAGPTGASSLQAALEIDAAASAQLFGAALQEKLIRRVTHTEPGAQFVVEVDAAQLASFLDWLGQRHTLHLGPRAADVAARGVAVEIVVVPPAPPTP